MYSCLYHSLKSHLGHFMCTMNRQVCLKAQTRGTPNSSARHVCVYLKLDFIFIEKNRTAMAVVASLLQICKQDSGNSNTSEPVRMSKFHVTLNDFCRIYSSLRTVSR